MTLLRPLPYLLFALVAAYSLIFYYRMPVWDHWDLIRFLQAEKNHQLTLSMLLANHGGHWHTAGWMVMLALVKLTHFTILYEILASLGFAALAMLAWVRFVRQMPEPSRVALLAVGAFFIFSLDQADSWLWGWQISVIMNVCGALGCIVLLATPELRWPHVLGAIAVSLLAIYNFATGLMLLPIGCLILLLRLDVERQSRAMFFALWACFCAAITYHYYLTFLAKPQGGLVIPEPLFILRFVATYLGAALMHSSETGAFVAGAMGIGIAAVAMLYAIHCRVVPRATLLVCGALMLYGLGSAVLTSLGRSEFGIKQALGPRYISFSNFFWLGLVVLLAMLCAQWKESRPRLRLSTLAVITLLMLSKGYNDVDLGIGYAAQSREYAAYRKEIMVTWPNVREEVLEKISWDKSAVPATKERLEFLHEEKLNLFRQK